MAVGLRLRAPGQGQRWWCLLPTVTTAALALALATFAGEEGIEAEQRAVVGLDQAGWPIAPELPIPDGIAHVLLPATSPALPPAERRWVLLDAPVANRAFPDLAALEAVLVDRCRTREADRATLAAHTHFHWWPPEPPPVFLQ